MAFLHALSEAITVAVTFNDVAVMSDAIEQRTRQLRIPKHFRPARKFQIGRQDHRPALIPFAAKLGQELAALCK